MPLRFFVDHCVPRFVSESLEKAGHEVLLLTNHVPNDAPDPAVIAKAQQLDAILVSVNGDFSDLVSYPPSKYGGIIALQIRNRPSILIQILERLKAHLLAHPQASWYRGKLLLVEAHRIRIRS